MLREPTEQEWNELITQFPKLLRIDVKIIEEFSNSTAYNCIGWSLGIDKWIDPPASLSHFSAKYRLYSIVPPLSDDAVIDGWGQNRTNMEHASRRWDGKWTSKIGLLCITHNRDGLRRDLSIPAYGEVLASFRPSEQLEQPEQMNVFLSADEKKRLSEKLGLKGIGLTSFDKAFLTWKSTWFEGALKFSSYTRDRAKGDVFTQLVNMGEPIVPLVVEKLADPDNFMALVLYEKLEKRPNLLAPIAPGSLESEQARSQRVVRLWLQQ